MEYKVLQTVVLDKDLPEYGMQRGADRGYRVPVRGVQGASRRQEANVPGVRDLVKRGWTPTYQVRAKAFSLTAATAEGVRQARRENLPRGTRVAQASVQVVAVRK